MIEISAKRSLSHQLMA